MSQRKHQAVKMLAGKRSADKYRIAEYGDRIESQVFQFVEFWDALFQAHPDLGRIPSEHLNNFGTWNFLHSKEHCRAGNQMNGPAQTGLLLGKLRQAIEGGNAKFFHDLADAIERYCHSPIDRARSWLIARFFFEMSDQNGGPLAKEYERVKVELRLFTAVELLEEMKQDGIRVDERQLRRFCKELDIELAKAKRGRPPKSSP